MAEIRNLTRNGETFYPLTCTDAIVNRDGNYAIDDEPTIYSDNLVKSSGIFRTNKYEKEIHITETTALSGWQSLPRPIEGLVFISSSKRIGFANGVSGFSFTIDPDSNTAGSYIYFDRPYYNYTNDTGQNNFEATIKFVDEEDIFGEAISPSYITNWQPGYMLDGVFHSTTNPSDWQFATIDVEVGKYYIVPFCNTTSVQSLVYLDNNSNFVSIAKTSTSENVVVNTFAIIKAQTSKLGITIYPKIRWLGANVTAAGLLKLPYLNISDCFCFTSQNEYSLPQIQNIIDLFNFNLTEVRTLEGGYFSNGGWEKTVYGSWRTAVFDVTPGEWYLVNCAIHANIRIFDVDSNGDGHVNESVPAAYYNIKSSEACSWALVKAKYNKLGVNVIDPVTRSDFSHYQYPKYVKLERTNNNGLIMLFLELYTIIENRFIKRHVVVRKSGGTDYTSLTKAIMDKMEIWGVTIYVDEGEYDLLSELEEYYGTSNFLSLTPSGRGIELGYDITIKASPKAIIKAHYTGDNVSMLQSFSPFNCYNATNVGGFSLIGVRIECSRCRYVIHDEKGSNGVGSYNNLYENCNFKIDNTNNPSWSSSACIGGGLGHSGSIIVRNCIFESIDPRFEGNACVSWHNNRRAGAKSYIACIGNYIKGNHGFRFSWYGESEEITDIILQGNNVGHATTTGPETQPDDPIYGPSLIENISVKEWNTTLRS